MDDRLYRSRDDRMITGVAGGVAEHIDADPSIIRDRVGDPIVLTGGLALLVYVVMAIWCPNAPQGWLRQRPGSIRRRGLCARPVAADGSWVAPGRSTVPMAASAPPRARRRRSYPVDRARAGLIGGLVLIGLGGLFLAREFLPTFDFDLWVADAPSGSAYSWSWSRSCPAAARADRALPYDGGVASVSMLTVLAGCGLVAGLVLLAGGLGAIGRSPVSATSPPRPSAPWRPARSASVASSQPAETTADSLLQSAPCVYYRATIGNGGDRTTPDWATPKSGRSGSACATRRGAFRVFPRDARVDAPVRFSGETDLDGDEPAGLALRRGGSTQATEVDRAMAVVALLEVHPPEGTAPWPGLRDRRGHRTYRETRIEPGDPITLVGRVLPFSDLADPEGADVGRSVSRPMTRRSAADLAAARATGRLADDPESAWGNAAIPGFGIGRPVIAPQIDPAAHALPLAAADEAAFAKRIFEIPPETLIMAASAEVPLYIAHGVPGAVVERAQLQFTVGLFGAVLAIVSAMVVAIDLSGGFGG